MPKRVEQFGRSLRLYFVPVVQWWFIVVLEVALASVGAYLDFWGTVEIPKWAWFSFGVVSAAVIPFIAFHRLRLRIDAHETRSAIRLRLSQALAEGRDLLNRNSPLKDSQVWANTLKMYVQDEIGADEAELLMSSHGFTFFGGTGESNFIKGRIRRIQSLIERFPTIETDNSPI